MTYQPDHTQYRFLPETIPSDVRAEAIGWLDARHRFPVGMADESLLDALWTLCRDHRTAVTRGFHQCELCSASGPLGLDVSRGGETLTLGNGEVRIVGERRVWLIAPDLIYHYVETHHYSPPHDFVSAVHRGTIAPVAERRAC